MSETFVPTDRSRARRRPQRVAYDEASVFAILDAALLAHVSYVLEGEPFVTPTTFWREGRRLYWHGAAASRMLAAQADGARVCLTVSHLDGLVVARSGFVHSALYRSVMAFGRARPVEGREAKRAAMDAFIDRLYPGRAATLRPALDAELDAICVMEMLIEEASAKVKDGGVARLPIDDAWSAWCGVVPVRQVVGAPQADPHFNPDAAPSPDLTHYADGARFDAALALAAAG